MVRIAILSDAHLLMQAEWLEDESQLTAEGEEVLENFERAMSKVAEDRPEVVILAGDMFDFRTKTRQRVAHREGEKYMVKIREVLEQLSDNAGCKIYALKGNHDSEPVLKSTEKALKGKFAYKGNDTVNVGNLSIFLMNSHYVPGIYDIPLDFAPKSADLLIMHESAPLYGVSAPSELTFRALCERFKCVFNGHMHTFQPQAIGIANLYMVPAFIPSREIKKSWMLRYRYPSNMEPEVRETPFGYVLFDDMKVTFRPYNPLQTIVRVEIKGEKVEHFLNGLREVYEILLKRTDREQLRVWIETNADPVTIERIFWPTVREYQEIRTVDVIYAKPEPHLVAVPPRVEFEKKAFTREELIERVLGSLTSKQRDIARRIFDEIFTSDFLMSRKPDEPTGFKKLLEVVSKNYKVSDGFLTKAWELAKEA